jgi:TolA-binding protein
MRFSLSAIFCLPLLAALAGPALASTTAAAPAPAPKAAVAPADEYFGRQKLSTLGIDNMIHDTDARESFDPELAARLYGPLMAAEDALEDWAKKYPHDTWIPKRAYLLSHLFWRMHSADADAAADRCRNLLFKSFPTNKYATLAHHETAATFAPPQTSMQTAASPSPAAAAPAPGTK